MRKLRHARVEGFPDDPIADRILLSHILRTALVSPDFWIPRYDQDGNEVQQPYQLPVPDHTETLVAE